MKGIFWNCRGLRDLAKHTFLHDVAEDNKHDFIALPETNKMVSRLSNWKFFVQGLILFGIGSVLGVCPGDANGDKSRFL
jgi:exonuclease III